MLEAIVAVVLRAFIEDIIFGALLAGIVYVATRTVALKAGARHALWMTALIAIAIMPVAGIATSFARMHTAGAPDATSPAQSVDLGATPERSQRRSHSRGDSRAALTQSPSALATAPAAASATTSWLNAVPAVSHTVAAALVIVWALGALIGLGGLLRSLLRVHSLKRRSFPLSVELSDELPWLVEVKRGSREMYLRLSDEIETPVAVGFRRPVILIPAELATADGLAAIESLVIHEHAHLARNDDWTNLVQRVIERIFWFNPLVWILGRRIALEREIASDDAVVDRTGQAQAYATSLWRLAREMRMPEHAVVAPGALFTRKQISIRIERLLAGDRARLHGSPLAAFAVTAAAAIAIVGIATSAPAVELPAPSPAPIAIIPPEFHAAAVDISAAPVPQPAASIAAHEAPHAVRRILVLVPQASAAPRVRPLPKASPALIAALAAMPNVGDDDAVPATSPEPPQTGERSAIASRGTLTRELVERCVGCSLKHADLHGLDLHGIGFNGTEMTGANLRGANLTDASFMGTELNGADFRDAILTRATFNGVSLRHVITHTASLRTIMLRCMGCDLDGINFRNADLHGVVLQGADFRRADLRGANLRDAVLTGVDFSHAQMDGADLRGAKLTGCDMTGVSFHNVNTAGAHFIGTDLGD